MVKKAGLIALVTVSAVFSLSAQDSVRISDFGYRPGSRENAVPVVQRAIEACKKRQNPVLVFSKGRYDFWPEYTTEKKYFESNTDVIPLRRCAILLEGMNDLIIDAGGSELIFHDRMQPFTFDHCNRVLLKNGSIDWDIPLTAQGTVEAVAAGYIDISINTRESPYIIENGKLNFVGEGWKSPMSDWGVMEFDRASRRIVPGTGDASCFGGDYSGYKADELSYGLVRLRYAFKRKPAKGNFLILRHSARDHAGVFIVDSKNIRVENVTVYQTAGLGILSQYSENLSFLNTRFIPNEAKGRMFDGHDDGLHFSNCRGQITVDSCRFVALMDDPINVHGTSVKIIEKLDSKRLLCRFMHEQSIGFEWAKNGDRIGVIDNRSMQTFATGTVSAFTPRDSVLFEVSFTEELPATVKTGFALENLNQTPDVLIKNSFFGSNRARGILMTTPGKVVIENNVFESSGSAILISGDANGWYESGAVKDVMIRNNVFNDPCLTSMYQFCEGIISIDPIIPQPESDKPFHRNIRIDHNLFNPFDYPVLYAKSTEGLSFVNNTVRRSSRFTAFHQRKDMITIESCKKVRIAGNRLEGQVLGKNVKLISTKKSELLLAKGQEIRLSAP